MNPINALRLILRTTNTRLIPPVHLRYSSTTGNTENEQAILEYEQPDTLYKTIELEMTGYEPATIKSYAKFTTMAAEHLGINVGSVWSPFKPLIDRNGLTILRSRFVHKKHRTQYEVRTYYKYANFHNLTGSTAETFLEYIERNLPEGVGLKVTKVAVEKLPSEIDELTSSTEENEYTNAEVKQ